MNYDAEINLARQVLSKTPDKWPTRSESVYYRETAEQIAARL